MAATAEVIDMTEESLWKTLVVEHNHALNQQREITAQAINRHGEALHRIHGRLDVVTDTLLEHTARFGEIGRCFDAVDRRFDDVDRRFDEMEERFDARFDAVDQRFDALDQKFDQKFEWLKENQKRFELSLGEIRSGIRQLISGRTEVDDLSDSG